MMFEKGESRHFSPFNPVLDVHTVISKFPVHQIEAQQWKDVVFTLSTSSGEIYKLLLQVVRSMVWKFMPGTFRLLFSTPTPTTQLTCSAGQLCHVQIYL